MSARGLVLTRALVREAIDQVSFVNAVIPTSVSMTQKQLRVLISTRDRDNGAAMTLQAGWSFPREGVSTRDHAISWVVACVRETWVHELHESIFFDGTRRNDLHEPGMATIRPPPRDLADPWWMWKVQQVQQVQQVRERGKAKVRRAEPHSHEEAMRSFALPDGWTWEPSQFKQSTCVVVKAPAGSATIDFVERSFDLVSQVPVVHYTGRNWRRTLVADAIEALRVRMPRHV